MADGELGIVLMPGFFDCRDFRVFRTTRIVAMQTEADEHRVKKGMNGYMDKIRLTLGEHEVDAYIDESVLPDGILAEYCLVKNGYQLRVS